MDSHAKVANEWAGLVGCASAVERNLKLSQKLVDENSLASLEKAFTDYLTRYRTILEMKKERV